MQLDPRAAGSENRTPVERERGKKEKKKKKKKRERELASLLVSYCQLATTKTTAMGRHSVEGIPVNISRPNNIESPRSRVKEQSTYGASLSLSLSHFIVRETSGHGQMGPTTRICKIVSRIGRWRRRVRYPVGAFDTARQIHRNDGFHSPDFFFVCCRGWR